MAELMLFLFSDASSSGVTGMGLFLDQVSVVPVRRPAVRVFFWGERLASTASISKLVIEGGGRGPRGPRFSVLFNSFNLGFSRKSSSLFLLLSLTRRRDSSLVVVNCSLGYKRMLLIH
jgi:hypothetical protein